MSEREATECAENGEVLRWSTDSEPEQTIDKPHQTTPESDTTGSTPEMFKSPYRRQSSGIRLNEISRKYSR